MRAQGCEHDPFDRIPMINVRATLPLKKRDL